MHPTDTLLSLSHARIARAAAAGPRRATQPTVQSDQQHMAQREQGVGGSFFVPAGDVRDPRWAVQPSKLELVLREAFAEGCVIADVRREGDTVIAKLSFNAEPARKALKDLARADGILAQRIDAL